jgi:hypothetical protein
MGLRDVCAYEDSKLVVQQIRGESQCLDGILNSYRDRCLDVVRSLDNFCIYHIPRENKRANTLARWASGYEVTTGMFIVKEESASCDTSSDESVDKEFYLSSNEVGQRHRTQGMGVDHRDSTRHAGRHKTNDVSCQGKPNQQGQVDRERRQYRLWEHEGEDGDRRAANISGVTEQVDRKQQCHQTKLEGEHC